ncbi:hypothetical protein RclHR1_08270005 [Rhizophagus clarus]|uniref:PiggyBac transposable element-derived protein domain-containing protein n=1 Tax=Rhizophagus clarus TaxID=94130 RepID=A0A2Z6RZT7_9GLOM|nr:hypothetical protein RclHR1_08270005 [Rhizophagus clarus]
MMSKICRGSNRGRGRGRGRDRGRGRGEGRNNNSERDNNNGEQIAQLPPPPFFNAFQHVRPLHEFKINLSRDFLLLPSPYSIFSLFFSLEQIEIIVKNTNKYAYVKNAGEGRNWKKLTTKEFKIWLAILIYAGVFKLPSIRDYWNKDSKFPEHKITTFMSLICFKQIKRFMHISDFSKTICIPSSNVSIDEMIARFSGRSAHTVRIKNKPTPEGYKILSLCDADYTYTFIFTSRIQTHPEIQQVSDLSKVGNEVYHLTSQLPIEDKSFNIYMDNYFSSIKLFKYLREKKIGACGTVRTNSANFPKVLKVNKKLDWDTLSGGGC